MGRDSAAATHPSLLGVWDELLRMGLAFKWVLDPECKELGRCLGSLGVCMPMWAHMLGPREIAVSYTMPLMSFAFVLGKAPAKCYLHCMH